MGEKKSLGYQQAYLHKPGKTHVSVNLKACIKSYCPLSVNTDTPNAERHTNLKNIADWLQGDANGSPKTGKSFKPISASGV